MNRRPLQRVQLAAAGPNVAPDLAQEQETPEHIAEEESHIHLPNPSFWPIILSAALLLCLGGFVFVDSFPWISIIAIPIVLIAILGWSLEDPMASHDQLARRAGPSTSYAQAALTGRPTAPAEAVLQQAKAVIEQTAGGAQQATPPVTTVTPYAQATLTGKPTALALAVLDEAQAVTERTVVVSSTEWSAHPVTVEIEREGVILALYGKVESAARSKAIQEELLKLPGVLHVNNYLTVEDTRPNPTVEIEREGVVLALYGKVELEAQSKQLEEELLKLPGVVDVNNYIVAEDAILNAVNARIEALRAAGKLEGAKNISALVENYIVNLYGEVPNNQMKYLLEREIVAIPRVRVVVNRINLGDTPGDLGKTLNRVGPG